MPFWPKKHLVAEVEKAAARPVSLAFQPFVGRFVQSRPRLEETYIRQAYGELIRSATKSILIANAYFLPPKELVAELYAAVQRGVKVTVITNSAKTNDIAQIAVLSRHPYRSLIGGGIDMYEWIGAELNEGTLHAKLAVFDDTTAIVGSYNLDPRSEKLNSETVLAFRSPALAGELAEIFRTQDLPKARKVTEAEAKKYENPPELKKKFEILFALPIRDYL